MNSDLRPYPKIKDSGVNWLGNVPEHWKTSQLGRIGRFFKGSGGTKEDESEHGVPCIRYGDLYTQHQFSITESRKRVEHGIAAAAYTPIRYGDVLFAGSGETIDEIGKSAVNLISGLACCGGDVIIFRPSIGVDARFLGYATNCPQAVSQKARMGRGITVMHIYWGDLKYMTIALPPLSEQHAIARFLDRADRRIRRYIRTKQRLIALLEEHKRTIIHKAVTGQIDVRTGHSYPAYKDSGVKCLGDVPADWKVKRLKHLVRRIDQGVSPQADKYLADSDTWGVLKAGCVNGGVFREGEHKRLSPGFLFDPLLAVNQGDVLVSRANGSPHLVGSVGRVSSLQYKLILSDKTFRPIFHKGIDPDFMVMAMNSHYYRLQVEEAVSGAEGLANNLPLSSLRSFSFLLPSMSKQHEIVEYLGRLTKQLSRATVHAERTIKLLREYRTRLIADVVTGKLDVCQVADQIPDEFEEPEFLAGSEAEAGVVAEAMGQLVATAQETEA